jgi:D-alanyl-D-alanine carboxypeptidase
MCASTGTNPTGQPIELGSESFAEIDRVLASAALPGVVVAVTDRKQTLKVLVHGYSDLKARRLLTPETRFAIGSISKSFTAVALMQLADEGRFDPQASVSHYVPWFRLKSSSQAITGHHLLAHTAGLPNYLADVASSRFVAARLQEFSPTYAPGEHYWYSNTGYQVLGALIEKIEASPCATVIQRRVLDSLGMNSSAPLIDDAQRGCVAVSYVPWSYDGEYVEAPWFEYTTNDGSVISNAQDMCGYLRFILNRGMTPAGRLLSESAFSTLTTPVLNDYAYGLIVQQEAGERVIRHGGTIGGFRALLEARMDQGLGVIILTNGGIDPSLQKWIVAAITAACRGSSPPPPPAHRSIGAVVDVKRYAGIYRMAHAGAARGDTALEFVVSGGSLARKVGADFKPLIRVGGDVFREAGPNHQGLAYFFGRLVESEDLPVTHVSRGSHWYVTDGFNGNIAPDAPSTYAAYVGHYANRGSEGPSARVFVCNGELVMIMGGSDGPPPKQPVEALVPDGEGAFRIGPFSYTPERARFDTLIDGQAQRLVISGVPLYRVDTP